MNVATVNIKRQVLTQQGPMPTQVCTIVPLGSSIALGLPPPIFPAFTIVLLFTENPSLSYPATYCINDFKQRIKKQQFQESGGNGNVQTVPECKEMSHLKN